MVVLVLAELRPLVRAMKVRTDSVARFSEDASPCIIFVNARRAARFDPMVALRRE
jgi:hypothetical protein